MIYDLPTNLDVCGKKIKIRSDFRAILDILVALNDPNLNSKEKAIVLLQIMYVDYQDITDYQEAINKAIWFIDCGNDYSNKKPKPIIMDWEQDFPLIVAPINRILGYECRHADYLHWWSFISAYYEIGECSYANVVNIRNKKRKNKKLEKWEREFYADNRELVDLKKKLSDDLQSEIDDILG